MAGSIPATAQKTYRGREKPRHARICKMQGVTDKVLSLRGYASDTNKPPLFPLFIF
nr:MAG TPA: hypothetical protein [Caudoviricetes sp.]